jgi:hypothetical protein
MKLHLTLLTFILISINSVFSQNNNLQFNRAIFDSVYITDPVYAGPKNFVGNLIVPTGKVWKIESSSGFRYSTYLPDPMQSQGSISALNWINKFCLNPDTKYPIWLPAGTYKVFSSDSSSGGSYSTVVSFTFSGIEFNLVP